MTLLHPTYIPNVASFAVIAQNEVCWEVHDNFQKQTARNRAIICTDRGALMLNIPIVHVGRDQGRQMYKDVQIDNSYPWQRQHWRTLQTAYRSSPFFEFYEDDIAPFYGGRYTFLLDYNLKFIESLCGCIQVDFPRTTTSGYIREPQGPTDARPLVDTKKKLPFEMPAYQQVFSDRHGFIPNLSVLDLLFNQGTSARAYLNGLKSDFLNG